VERDTRNDLQFEVQFFEGLTALDENFVDALIPLGDAYTKLGQFEKGLNVDLRLSRLRPQDPTVYYNLACSHSLLQQIDLAYKALERAIELGYSDFAYLMSDGDLKNLMNDRRFPAFLRRLLPTSGGDSAT
jgi:tetratricopeptide (TPR) repeat protein